MEGVVRASYKRFIELEHRRASMVPPVLALRLQDTCLPNQRRPVRAQHGKEV